MGIRIIVENDKVEGQDRHNVEGDAVVGTSTVPYVGTAVFDYVGKMTDSLSDFVFIDGQPVALTSSESSLDPGEDAAPAGRHSGPMGSDFLPPNPNLLIPTVEITDPVGTGRPAASAGSSLVRVGGTPVLLDGDVIDTCDSLPAPSPPTVQAGRQDFVEVSE